MPPQVKFECSGMSALENEVIRGGMVQPEA